MQVQFHWKKGNYEKRSHILKNSVCPHGFPTPSFEKNVKIFCKRRKANFKALCKIRIQKTGNAGKTTREVFQISFKNRKKTMNKFKLLGLSFFLLVLAISVGATITNYEVPQSINLHDTLTITGKYSAADTLCSFILFNTDTPRRAIIRLSDQYSFSDGTFYAEYVINEPLFRRFNDFNAVTTCGTDTVSQVFTVGQKEDIAFGINSTAMVNDFAFFLDQDSSLTLVIFGVVFLVGIGLVALILTQTGIWF